MMPRGWGFSIIMRIWGRDGEGNGTPLQYFCLENPMDGGAWKAAVHGVAESRTWLSDFIFTFHFHALEKEMATYSSVLTWRIPGTGEPVGLPSMGSHRVGHDWSNLAAAAAACLHELKEKFCSSSTALSFYPWKCISLYTHTHTHTHTHTQVHVKSKFRQNNPHQLTCRYCSDRGVWDGHSMSKGQLS